jgi:Fe-S cluster assembly ATP-binding protein
MMGHPSYEITSGTMMIDDIDMQTLSPDQRSNAGIFLAFQSIPEIKGIKLFEFLRTIYNAKHATKESFVSFKKILEPILHELSIDKEFLRRDLNVGFS